NYRAYTSRGASVWAQAYGATLDTQFDPQSVVERLLRNGVPAGMAQPVLAAGQSPGAYQGNFAEFSVDDLTPSDFQSMGLTPAAAQIPAAAAAAPVQQEPYVAQPPQADRATAVPRAPAAPGSAAEVCALRRPPHVVG